MKSLKKVLFFLVLLTLCDLLLRKGFIAFFLPFQLPYNLNVLLVYTLFALAACWLTKRFAHSDKVTLSDLGIDLNRANQSDFIIGFFVGVILWGVVAMCQAYSAGFSWVLRPDVSMLSMLYGLLFIFIADLGTELYTRGYPLSKLESGIGAKAAIVFMLVIEVIKGFAYNPIGDELFVYAVLIPCLHIVFFSIIYFKTKRLGASLGIHTGANFITISVFDLREIQEGQAIPPGLFQANTALENLSIPALQIPWVGMAMLFSIAVYLWWNK